MGEGSENPLRLQFHPRRRVIARVRFAADPSVDAGGLEARFQPRAEQQVVDAQAGVAAPAVAEVIPKGVNDFILLLCGKFVNS